MKRWLVIIGIGTAALVLATALLGRPSSGTAAPVVQAPAASAPPLDEAAVSARDRQRFDALAGKLMAEPRDPRWAPATEALITKTLVKPVFQGSTLLAASCRSTLCRFEVRHDSQEHRRRFASILPPRLPSLPSGSMRHGEGDAFTTIVYVAREGHRIPRDESP